MNPILKKLGGRDRRSIGKSEEVVAEVLARPALFPLLFEGTLTGDPVVRMRAADALEKVTQQRPEYLQRFKARLINEVSRIDQQEVRWHVAQLFSRLHLKPGERQTVCGILLEYLNDRSNIVKTFSMQALADIAGQDDSLRRRIVPLLERLTRTGSPAMKSRGKKLIAALRARPATRRRVQGTRAR